MTTRSVARRTIGIAEKVSWPSAVVTAAGVGLAVLDLLGVIDVEDELWITLLGAGGVTFGVGYVAPAPVVSSHLNGDSHEPTPR